MAFDPFSIALWASPLDHDPGEDHNDIPGALKYGIRSYLGMNALYRMQDKLFPSDLDQEKIAEERLKNRLMAHELGLSDDDVEEMAYGPSLSSRLRSGVGKVLFSMAMK